MTSAEKTVAVIGGGITGLTAAFRLRERRIPVTLYEATGRVGGVIETSRHDGYLAEFGPNSILETSPKVSELIRDAGLEARRIYSAPEAENRFIVRGGRPVPMPSSPWGFVKTPLFSASAKLRLVAEPFIRRANDGSEESIAEFVIRRIGSEFLDYAINPLVAGVYAGNPARLSVKHAFPKLYALEQKYGSLILGQIFGARERKQRGEVAKDRAKKLSFDEGLQVLTNTLQARLDDAIRLNSPVCGVQKRADGWSVSAKINGREEVQRHSAIIFAGPAYKLPEIGLETDCNIEWSALGRIVYPPVASVVLGFRREEVAHPLNGFGMLIPEVERFKILGTIFSSSLFPNRAPAGHVTLTSYIGGSRSPELAQRDPDELVDITVKDLQKLLGVSGRPTFRHPVIFPKAIPQYEVGFGVFKELMNDLERKAPGLFMAGHYRNGISLSDSIVSGNDVAQRIEEFLRNAMPDSRSGIKMAA